MPWITLPEACAALGCSDRTLSRRIAAGTYETKHEGGRKLVYLSLDQAHKPLGQMAEVGTANALQRQANQQTLSRQVDMAEKQTRSAWRVAYCGLAVASILAVGFVAYAAWSLEKRDSDRSAASAKLSEVFANLADHKARSEVVAGLLTDERKRADSLAERVGVLTTDKAETEAREAMLLEDLGRMDQKRIAGVRRVENTSARLDLALQRLGGLGVGLHDQGDPDQVAEASTP